jgi:acetylornithine deacetylase
MRDLDVVQLTARFVAIDSVTKNSNVAIADAVEPLMRQAGFEVERIEFRDTVGVPKVNLVGIKGSGIGGLGFFAHLDTVPGTGWDRDPWAPVIDGDRLVGLGSCDMKGPLAATLAAAAGIDAARLQRPILFAAAADEETTLGGASEVLARSELLRAAGVRHGVITEPTRLVPVVAHKGGVMIKVTAHGVAAHTSTDQGISANFLIAPFLAEMADFAGVLKRDSTYHRSEFTPPTLGFNMTLDDGGCKQNVTAPKSVCILSFRPMPNDRSREVMDYITERARHYDLEVNPTVFAPFAAPANAEIVRAALAATGAVAGETVPYGTEASVYQDALELVILGPGDVAQAHTNGEWISIPQLNAAVTIYTRLIELLCM